MCVCCRISEFFVSQRLFSPLFPLSCSACFVLWGCYSIQNRLHIILNPMFTQFTVHISSVQNPKTNKNTLYLYMLLLLFSGIGKRKRFCVLCTHTHTIRNETKRNALSSAYKFYSNAHTISSQFVHWLLFVAFTGTALSLLKALNLSAFDGNLYIYKYTSYISTA